MLSTERILLQAEFNRSVRTYWLLYGAIVLTVTVVGICLLPFWFLLGNYFTEIYLRRMHCTLTDRSLKVGRGFLVRVEKTVPLDKITDLGLVQGPIMRLLDIEALSVETAGQSSDGSLVTLVGIVKARAFRDAVLAQRDKVVASADRETPSVAAAAPAGHDTALLTEIRDILSRIERRLSEGS